MNIFFDEHIAILKTLLKNDVEFILIGGYAVIYHGYRRTTGDMDLWIKPDNSNKLNLLNALEELDFDKTDLLELNKLDFTKHLTFSIGDNPYKVDFLTYINLVTWEEASKEKLNFEVDNTKIPVLHLNHLLLSKINTDRLKDKADIEELQKIMNNKK